MDPNVLSLHFHIGANVLSRNIAGITDEESRREPPQGGNSLNWVVGHVVRTRNETLGLLGQQPLYDEAEFSAYVAGGDPAAQLPLGELVDRFTILGKQLATAVAAATPDSMDAPAPFSPTGEPDETIGSLLASIAFHESYHLGQTGLLRRLLGKAGAIQAQGEATR